MKKFVTVEYRIESDKIKRPFTVVMISDLHNVVFGEKNVRLLEKIRDLGPDFLVIAGDLVLGKPGASFKGGQAAVKFPSYFPYLFHTLE